MGLQGDNEKASLPELRLGTQSSHGSWPDPKHNRRHHERQIVMEARGPILLRHRHRPRQILPSHVKENEPNGVCSNGSMNPKGVT
jgi:hypothetical protein